MRWRQSPPELIQLFDRVLPGPPEAARRTMFGYPRAFVNGNMFAGLHQERFFLRFDEQRRNRLIERERAAIFEPMSGRPMREYVVVPAHVLSNTRRLRQWVRWALDYARALPSRGGKRRARNRSGRLHRSES